MSPSVESQHVFLPVFHPFDRPLQEDRYVGNGDFFREKASLLAEPASNVRRHDTYTALRPVQQLHQILSHFVGMLGGVPHREKVVAGLVVGQHAPGLHGRRRQPLHLKLLPYHPVSLAEGPVQVTPGVDGAQYYVATQVLVEQRSVIPHGSQGVDQTGQWFIVHHDLLYPVSSRLGVLGHHDGHRLADVGHLALSEHRMGWRAHLVGVGVGPGRQIFDHAREIIRGKHGNDPGQTARG